MLKGRSTSNRRKKPTHKKKTKVMQKMVRTSQKSAKVISRARKR